MVTGEFTVKLMVDGWVLMGDNGTADGGSWEQPQPPLGSAMLPPSPFSGAPWSPGASLRGSEFLNSPG